MNQINGYWRKIKEYGNKKEFLFWSKKVTGIGDKTLNDNSKIPEWKRIIILEPKGDPKIIFEIGFQAFNGSIEMTTVSREINQGPFAMRMGREDCKFFIASNQGELDLKIDRYADINDDLDIDLY